MKKRDVIIIGNGILGYSTAFALLQKDKNLKITIIGKRHKSGGATLAAGAMLGCFGEITEKSLDSVYGQNKFDCSLKAKYMWHEWLQKINEESKDDVKINYGTYIIHNNVSGNIDTKNYRKIKENLEKNNEKHENIHFEDIPGISTLENMRSLEAIYIPDENSICAASFLESLHKALKKKQNIDILEEDVRKISTSESKIKNITLSNDKIIETPFIVLAAGAYSQTLLDQIPELSQKIPRVLSGVGQAVLVTKNRNKIQNVIRTPNRAGACGLHILPYGPDHLYVGATNELKIDPEDLPSVGMIHFLLECVLDQINQNFFPKKICKIMTGNRPSPIDGFPLLGSCSIDNLFILTGTYRDGFHQSPYIAYSAANSIIDQTPMLEGIFSPERNAIKTSSREESIDEAVEHQMATAYEAGAKFPHAFWSESAKRHIKSDILDLYEKLKININLLPEHTLMFRDHQHDKDFMNFFKDYFKNNDN